MGLILTDGDTSDISLKWGFKSETVAHHAFLIVNSMNKMGNVSCYHFFRNFKIDDSTEDVVKSIQALIVENVHHDTLLECVFFSSLVVIFYFYYRMKGQNRLFVDIHMDGVQDMSVVSLTLRQFYTNQGILSSVKTPPRNVCRWLGKENQCIMRLQGVCSELVCVFFCEI